MMRLLRRLIALFAALAALPAPAPAIAASINQAGSVTLKINSAASTTYRAEIYRMGFYGGAGGRLFSTVLGIAGTAQPACTSNTTTGLYDCSNWSSSVTLTTTASWP